MLCGDDAATRTSRKSISELVLEFLIKTIASVCVGDVGDFRTKKTCITARIAVRYWLRRDDVIGSPLAATEL